METMEAMNGVERALLARAREQKAPVNGSIELLPLCNMNCDMCYVRMSREEMERRGRLRTLEEWTALGRQMADAGVLFLLLTGGEPLLYPDFKELYLALKAMGMILTINTNGTLIDEEWADFFGRHKPRRVNITLYGADDRAYVELCHYPGGFEKTVNAVRLLRGRGVDVKIGGSVTGRNAADLERILEIGRELDVPVRMDTYMMPGVRERGRPFNEQARLSPEEAAGARITALRQEMGPELWAGYVEESLRRVRAGETSSRKVTCMGGNCSFTVNWQGELRSCVVLTEPSVPVFERGFEAAWQEIREKAKSLRMNDKCGRCRLRPVCKVCPAASRLETGACDGLPEYLCRNAKALHRLLTEELREDK